MITGHIIRIHGYGVQCQVRIEQEDGTQATVRISDSEQTDRLYQAQRDGKRVRVETMGFALGGYLAKSVEVVG